MDPLSDDINLNQLLMNHLTEIETLRKASNVKKKCAIFQSIPREMRRRAASNNPKRRPKSIQKGVLPIIKKSKFKRCRKSRLKIKSRLSFHTPLHMWFTKRFVLLENWGKLLPEHNNLKNRRLLFRTQSSGFSVFFLAHLKSFTIDISQSTNSDMQIIEIFKKYCSDDDIELLHKLNSMQEEIIHIYDKQQNSMIGPCRVVFIKIRQDPLFIKKCLVTTHIQIYDKIFELFENSIGTNISVKQSNICHVRMIGSNSQKALKRRLFKRELVLPQNEYKFFSVKEGDSLTDLDFNKFLDRENTKKSPETLLTLLLKCTTQCDISSVHLMIHESQLRIIWNAIVENCNIHVGGWRDLKELSLNNYLPVFPQIGYYDASNANVAIVRSENQAQNNEMDTWIYAKLIYEFGCAEKDQKLFFLSENCYKEVIDRKDLRFRQIRFEKLDCAIGYVEYGGYSMKEGKSIAIGRFKINDWKQIVLRSNEFCKKKNMFVLAENDCKQLYLVTVSFLNLAYNNPFNL